MRTLYLHILIGILLANMAYSMDAPIFDKACLEAKAEIHEKKAELIEAEIKYLEENIKDLNKLIKIVDKLKTKSEEKAKYEAKIPEYRLS